MGSVGPLLEPHSEDMRLKKPSNGWLQVDSCWVFATKLSKPRTFC